VRRTRPYCENSKASFLKQLSRSRSSRLGLFYFRGRSSRGGQAHEDLEVILDRGQRKSAIRRVSTHVNHPLETSQCSDHDDSDGETIPETHKSNVLVDTSHSGPKSLTRGAVRVEF
jgi:hypothetical protein